LVGEAGLVAGVLVSATAHSAKPKDNRARANGATRLTNPK
jgi:hypothetical protein